LHKRRGAIRDVPPCSDGSRVRLEVTLADIQRVYGVKLLDAQFRSQLVGDVVSDVVQQGRDVARGGAHDRGRKRAPLAGDAGPARAGGGTRLVVRRRTDNILPQLGGVELLGTRKYIRYL
jgi:hypothetical protein